MTLALLLTAVTGAWAEESESITTTLPEAQTGSVEFTGTHFKITGQRADGDGMNLGSSTNRTITISALNGEIITKVEMTIGFKFYSWEWEVLSTKGNVSGNYTTGYNLTLTDVDVSEVTLSASNTTTGYLQFNKFKIFYTMPAGTMTLNADNTEATMEMPASDVTVTYELVRDMQDEANPVAFSGLPSNDEPIVVKKGDDGKYQPAEALTIQLIDPLAAAEAQNIIAADGITVKVLVGAENELGAIDYDHDNPITLEAFLADMKPGYYWIKAEPTDENSPYDGTVYSSQFTVVEQYDLTVKPANDFSKGKVESVTVGTETVTIDANTGEATKTSIDPGTEVKIKAKRGYVIDKVEAKKFVPAEGHDLTASAVGDIVGSDGKTYAAADKDNLPKNVTAVAMVAYKNGTGGLAIALSDEGSMNWSTAKSTCESKTAISGATWRLPSKNQWEQIFSANGGNSNSYTGLNTAIDNAGGTALVAGNVYWTTSSGMVSGTYFCMMINNGGSIGSMTGSPGKNKMTRAILTF